MDSINELMRLNNKVACITGGSGHVGASIAHAFAELGAKIILMSQYQNECEDSARRIKEKWNCEIHCIYADMENEKEIRSIRDFIAKAYGHLDILVNSAAFVGTNALNGWAVEFQKQSVDTWRRAIEVNLTAPFILVQSCLDLLKKSGNSSIINIGSIYGHYGPDMSIYEGTSMGNPAAYAASKGGLAQLTRWLATTLAPDIRVNLVAPGGIYRGQDDRFVQQYCKKTPLKRMAKEFDIAGTVAFLASDLAAYITGQTIFVDGGWSIW